MASDVPPGCDHPAPARHKAGVGSLSLGLAVPPLVWSAQSIVGYAISSRTCFAGDELRVMPRLDHLGEILLTISVAAFVLCLMSAASAYRNWLATRQEQGGDRAEIIERGEGRTRFLAISGVLVGATFAVATAFSAVSILLSPLCR